MNMKISVVMAVYNGSKYIGQQLESIINQEVLPTEIIIIDDASRVSCSEIISRYKKMYQDIDIRYYEHLMNEGYARTFFEALQYAGGDYIFFADQDDIWKKNKIKVMIKEFKKIRKSNVLPVKI